MHKIAIIGAGGTGRGFLPRLLEREDVTIAFIDRNEQLVRQLNQAKRYNIFVGESQTAHPIGRYTASVWDEAGLAAAAAADYLFVSVGAENLPSLAPALDEVATRRPAEELRIVVCENGISPKTILRCALEKTAARTAQITQGVIFCSSLPRAAGELDIVSEQFDTMPYDVDERLFELPFAAFAPTERFDRLLRQKIYTYNCLSACIAYLGYMKGYTDYGAAGNDEQIAACCEELREPLDQAVSRELEIPAQEQRALSDRALKKFRDRTIRDTIEKNARAAARKLAAGERLMGPMALFEAFGLDTQMLCLTCGAALLYLAREESLIAGGTAYASPMDLLRAVNASPALGEQTLARIERAYRCFAGGGTLESCRSDANL